MQDCVGRLRGVGFRIKYHSVYTECPVRSQRPSLVPRYCSRSELDGEWQGWVRVSNEEVRAHTALAGVAPRHT